MAKDLHSSAPTPKATSRMKSAPRSTSGQVTDTLEHIIQLAGRLAKLEQELRARRGDAFDGFPAGRGLPSRPPGGGGHSDPVGQLAAALADDGHRLDEATRAHRRLARLVLEAFTVLGRSYLGAQTAAGKPPQ